jgi:hypothetical protein
MFLLEICCKENDLWVIAESLDAMFDVFGEDHLDPIVREIQMVERLKSLLPTLKSQVRSFRSYSNRWRPSVCPSRMGFRITCQRKVGLKLGVVCILYVYLMNI